jgi:hypothetical protein
MSNTPKTPADAGPDLQRRVMQHTPGPWHATCGEEWKTGNGEHIQWGRFDISAGSANGEDEHYYRIASVSNVNNSEQNQWNAKLIAAAPDMLEALRKAVVLLAGACVHSPELEPHETYEAVSAAIAKATGCAA